MHVPREAMEMENDYFDAYLIHRLRNNSTETVQPKSSILLAFQFFFLLLLGNFYGHFLAFLGGEIAA